MLKAVLFDLDGTLLGNNMMEGFIPHYFEKLAAHMAPYVSPDRLIEGVRMGSEAISRNDGSRTNEEVFAEVFYAHVGEPREVLEPHLTAFYRDVFPTLREHTYRKPEARRVVATAFELDYRVAVATNPYFPAAAIRERLRWAGVAGFPYDRVTTYENSHYAKPDLRYFEEVLQALECDPSQTLMIGDEAMDMVAAELGCETFLVTSGATQKETIRSEPTYEGHLADVLPILKEAQG